MGERALSHFEFWPSWLFYLPIKIYAAFLALRYGGLSSALSANPSIFASGFVGESKTEIMKIVPDALKPLFAEHCYAQSRDVLVAAMQDSNLNYPIVAKPDKGERGAAVQIVRDEEELVNYAANFPENEGVFLQNLYDYPKEVGLFYIRKPDETVGKIFSLTLKKFPHVIGDGKSTLKQLIMADPRAGSVAKLYLKRHTAKLEDVIPAGKKFRLVFSGSHCQGAVFENGAEMITPKMTQVWDNLTKQIPDLYFCRFDVRYNNPEDLETLENLKIIEINGAGAEATHIWDANMSLREAYSVLMQQYKLLFQIGQQNKRKGFKPISLFRLRKIIKSNESLQKKFPVTH